MTKNKQYRVSVYERIEQAVIEGKEPIFEDYKQELIFLGHGDGDENKCQKEFVGYYKRVEFAWKMIKKLSEEGNLNPGNLTKEVANIFSKTTPKEVVDEFSTNQMALRNTPTLHYKLSEKQKEWAKKSIEAGRYRPKKGEELSYKDKFTGEEKVVASHSYKNLPRNTDALVVFSGHNDTANKAVEAYLSCYKNHRKLPKLFFLGLVDHQNNTAFGNDEYKFRVDSEAEMYRRMFKAHGIPSELVDECIVTPNDVTTAQNGELLKTCIDKYLGDKANVALIGYAAYEQRMAAEFPKLLKDSNKDINFIIADVLESKDKLHAVENLEGEAKHITSGGNQANLVRAYGEYEDDNAQRLNNAVSERGLNYQEKTLLLTGTGHGWPNHITENVTMENKTAMLRWVMNKIDLTSRDEADPKVQDKQIELSVLKSKKKLVVLGLLPEEVAKSQNLSKDEFLTSIDKMHNNRINKYQEIVASKRIR